MTCGATHAPLGKTEPLPKSVSRRRLPRLAEAQDTHHLGGDRVRRGAGHNIDLAVACAIVVADFLFGFRGVGYVVEEADVLMLLDDGKAEGMHGPAWRRCSEPEGVMVVRERREF